VVEKATSFGLTPFLETYELGVVCLWKSLVIGGYSAAAFKVNDSLLVNGKSIASSSLTPGKWIKQGKQHG